MHAKHVSTYHLFRALTSEPYVPTMSTSCFACQWVSCGRPMLLRRRFLCHRRLGDVSDALTLQLCRALSQSLRYLHHQQRPVGRCRCQGIALFRVHTCRSLLHQQRSQRHPWTKGVRACGLMRSSYRQLLHGRRHLRRMLVPFRQQRSQRPDGLQARFWVLECEPPTMLKYPTPAVSLA